MKIVWTPPLQQHMRTILQEAGYHVFYDRRTQKESFIMRISRDFYPRFHIYVAQHTPRVELDVHIDQKKQSLGSRLHAGEYDGTVVAEEVARLTRWLEYYKTTS